MPTVFELLGEGRKLANDLGVELSALLLGCCVENLAEELGALVREKQKALLSYSERMVRENLIMNRNLGQMVRLTDDEADFAQKFSRFIHPQNSGFIAEALDKACYHILRNASAKIVFMDTIITLARCLRMPAPQS